MTTTDLRDQIARALYVESCEEEDGAQTWETPESVAEEVESWERFADAVLAVIRPLIAREKAEAWDECAQWHAEQGMGVHEAWTGEANPYRQETDRG